MLVLKKHLRRGEDKMVGNCETYSSIRDYNKDTIVAVAFGKYHDPGGRYYVNMNGQGAKALVSSIARQLFSFSGGDDRAVPQYGASLKLEGNKNGAEWLRQLASDVEAGVVFWPEG